MPKICPLLLISLNQGGIIDDPEKMWARCLEDECMWYTSYEMSGMRINKDCALKLLAQSVHTIRKNIK